MPTADRTTIKAAFSELVELLRDNVAADPPTAAAPFRRVFEGPAKGTEHPRPFLSLHLERTRLLGVTEDDKLIEVELRLRVVGDVTGGDAHAALLDLAGAVDDYLDSLRDIGVVEGAEGFDDREWTYELATGTAGARSAAAEAKGTFVVRVEREKNREPAA